MDRRAVMLGLAGLAGVASARAENGSELRSFTSGGVPIGAEWFPAAGAATAPAILLLHGADGTTYADRYRMAATLVAASGYHVALLRYLDRTGESRVGYSTLRERYPVWAETIRDGLGWIAGEPGVDAARLGLVGVSLGGALALTVAASDPRVRAVVEYSGPLPEGLSGTLPPTLVLHGEADRTVPASHAREIEKRLVASGTPHEVQIYPGQGHAFSGTAQLDAASRTAGFLGRYLKGT